MQKVAFEFAEHELSTLVRAILHSFYTEPFAAEWDAKHHFPQGDFFVSFFLLTLRSRHASKGGTTWLWRYVVMSTNFVLLPTNFLCFTLVVLNPPEYLCFV